MQIPLDYHVDTGTSTRAGRNQDHVGLHQTANRNIPARGEEPSPGRGICNSLREHPRARGGTPGENDGQ